MRRADRLFELIHLLRPARKAITAAQLAEALEVAPRTIYRDVAALMGMRVPNKAFGAGADMWLRLQAAYDLAQAMKHADEIKVERLLPAA